MKWKIYLSGEIHTNWRDELRLGASEAGLNVEFLRPETDHDLSDNSGANILGSEDKKFWHDHKGASINAIRNTTLIKNADILIVKFGDQYRQWNAAFDAGMAKALDKPIITLHDNTLNHALKEVNQAASASCRSVEQVVNILSYLINGTLEKQSLNVAE